jgi:hypothetical protein
MTRTTRISKPRSQRHKTPPVCSHEWIDLIDLAVHRAIVKKIKKNPILYTRARRNLAKWEKRHRCSTAAWREWENILREQPMTDVLRLLVRTDHEGDRLRSTAPFCGILSQTEIEDVWARYDKKPVGEPFATRG